jgi:hypothetical protein
MEGVVRLLERPRKSRHIPRMKTPLCLLIVFSLSALSSASDRQTRRSDNRRTQLENNIPVLATEAEWTEVFTYWPMPFIEDALVDRRYRLMQLPQPLGLYRLSLDNQGAVTEIKILRRMGPPFDAIVLKALINWRAKPGPSRAVTVFLRYGQKHRVSTAIAREWGFAPGRL